MEQKPSFGKSLLSQIQTDINRIFEFYRVFPSSNYTSILLFLIVAGIVGSGVILLWTGLLFTVFNPGYSFFETLMDMDYQVIDQIRMTGSFLEILVLLFLARFFMNVDHSKKFSYSDIVRSLPKPNGAYTLGVLFVFAFSLLFIKEYEFMDMDTMDHTLLPFWGEPVRYGVFADKILYLLADLIPIFTGLVIYHSTYDKTQKLFKEMNWNKLVSGLILLVSVTILGGSLISSSSDFIIQPITTYFQNPVIVIFLLVMTYGGILLILTPAKALCFGTSNYQAISTALAEEEDEILDEKVDL